MIKLKRKRKWIASLLLVVFLLTGCNQDIKITTGLSEKEIFKLSGESEPISEILLLLVNEKNQYEQNLGKDIWNQTFGDVSLETELKEQIKTKMIELSVICKMAQKDELSIEPEIEEKIELAAKEYYDTLTEEEKTLTGATLTDVVSLYQKMYLSDLYYESKTAGKVEEISDEAAKVIQVMYIYLKTGEMDIHGNVVAYNEETLAQIEQKGQQILEKLSQGADFYSLIQEYSDDTEYEVSFGRGTMEDAFEDAAFSLATGETSELVETKGGIYIMKCVQDYLAAQTEENKVSMQEKLESEKFMDIYRPFMETQEVEFHNKVWDKIKISDFANVTTDTFYEVYHNYFV